MARLEWGDPANRRFEIGVEKGVIYPTGDSPTAWDGLVSVTEAPDAEEVENWYLDGVKTLSIPGQEDFAGTIESFNRPRAILLAEGFRNMNGLYVDNQPRRSFGMSYRTLAGSEASRNSEYNLHLVYNVLLGASERAYKTQSDSVEPVVVSWPFSTTPKHLSGVRPTAHFVVPSTHDNVSVLEDVLYGTLATAPRLPEPAELFTILN